MHLELTADIGDYLAPSPLIDVDHPAIRAQATELRKPTPPRSSAPLPKREGEESEVDFVRRAYEFVRDEVSHSWDLQSRRVTAKASEVLEYREGICYAKSHLLAALLRAEGVPAGICYQRLVLFVDPKDGYSLHAMNAVYLASIDRWIRLDARGNKPGVDARFSLGEEQLAFPVRPEMGEIDYPYNFAAPPECIVDTLLGNVDCFAMYARGLPSDLDV